MAGKKSHLGLRGFDPRSPFYFFSRPEGSERCRRTRKICHLRQHPAGRHDTEAEHDLSIRLKSTADT